MLICLEIEVTCLLHVIHIYIEPKTFHLNFHWKVFTVLLLCLCVPILIKAIKTSAKATRPVQYRFMCHSQSWESTPEPLHLESLSLMYGPCLIVVWFLTVIKILFYVSNNHWKRFMPKRIHYKLFALRVRIIDS